MRLRNSILLGALILLALLAFAAEPAKPSPILPHQFAGWKVSGTPRFSGDPAVADPVNAALLKEYGFSDFESATYTRDDGGKLTIKAARFPDASGAYGAFDYYRSDDMLAEKIGDQGASLTQRVLFYRGSVLVDAVFDKLNAMSAAELRELSNLLPLPPANAQGLSAFLSYFPRPAGHPPTIKYVLGPVGLHKINAPVPAPLVDFSTGSEVALATYPNDANLMLIYYPTPQIAAAHLRTLEAAVQQNTLQPGSVPALATGPILSKRTGPIIVVVSGSVPRGTAESLLSSVNYEANVTWNEANPFDKHNNIGTIVVNALLFSGIVSVLALIAGLAFGGARVLLRKLLPNTALGQSDEAQFISLHLEEGPSDPSDAKVS